MNYNQIVLVEVYMLLQLKGGLLMKKTLSLFLAVLMIFSAFSATLAFAAEGEIHKVSFIDYDGTVIVIKDVPYGATTRAPQNPERADETVGGVTYEFDFKGWERVGGDGTLYYEQTIPACDGNTAYKAVYSQSEKEEVITFWNLIRDFFAKINMIFEYFSKIFSGENG